MGLLFDRETRGAHAAVADITDPSHRGIRAPHIPRRSRTARSGCDRAREAARLRRVSGMLTGHLEGRFLKMLVAISGARRILEIGTYTGYSAMSMAEALPADGQMITCEIDERHAAWRASTSPTSPDASKIEVRVGPALDTIARSMARSTWSSSMPTRPATARTTTPSCRCCRSAGSSASTTCCGPVRCSIVGTDRVDGCAARAQRLHRQRPARRVRDGADPRRSDDRPARARLSQSDSACRQPAWSSGSDVVASTSAHTEGFVRCDD